MPCQRNEKLHNELVSSSVTGKTQNKTRKTNVIIDFQQHKRKNGSQNKKKEKFGERTCLHLAFGGRVKMCRRELESNRH